MNLATILAAVQTRWTAKSVSATVTGGLHTHRIPDGTAMPYCAVTQVASSIRMRTNGGGTDGATEQFEATMIQFSLYDDGGMTALMTLADAIKAAFDEATLTLTGGTFYRLRFVSEAVTDSPDHRNALLWVGSYELLSSQEKTLNPS